MRLVGFKYAGRTFRIGAVEEKHIDWLATAASKVGEIRICFNILRTAGLWAECEGKAKLEREHFIKAAKTMRHTI